MQVNATDIINFGAALNNVRDDILFPRQYRDDPLFVV